MCGDDGREELGGSPGWSGHSHRGSIHNNMEGYALAVRLRDGRDSGRWSMLMVKLDSGVGMAGTVIGSGGGWSCC